MWRKRPSVSVSRTCLGLFVQILGICALARSAQADDCSVEGVRLWVEHAGPSSTAEISVRLSRLASPTCQIDWPLLTLSSPTGQTAPALFAARTFVNHVPEASMVLADGLSAAELRTWTGTVSPEGTVIAMRLWIEGTAEGLTLELPRRTLPAKTSSGARLEFRAKSTVGGKATFGSLGDINVPATPAGPAGGVGPAGPLDVTLRDAPDARAARLALEIAPSTITYEAPTALKILEVYRQILPLRAFTLSVDDSSGFDELARRAYAAALHADPILATLGASALSVLANGLSRAAMPFAAGLPTELSATIGNIPARLQQRHGTTARPFALGRSTTYRESLKLEPDEARRNAAKAAVTRLVAACCSGDPASTFLVELAAVTPKSIIDDISPTDPPIAGKALSADVRSVAPEIKSDPLKRGARRTIPQQSGQSRRTRRTRAMFWSLIGVGIVALVLWRSEGAARASDLR